MASTAEKQSKGVSSPTQRASFTASDSNAFLSTEHLANLKEHQYFKRVRTWHDFADLKHISSPTDGATAMRRVTYNVHHYQANYAVLVILLCLIVLLRNIPLLLVLVFVAVASQRISQMPSDVSLLQVQGFHIFRQTLIYILAACTEIFISQSAGQQHTDGLHKVTLIAFWGTSAMGDFFLLLGISAAVILMHAGMREITGRTDDPSADEV